MRYLTAALAALALLAPGIADAKPAQAESKVAVASGPFRRAVDWAPAGRPRLGDDLTIPAGVRIELTERGEAGSVTVAPGGDLGGSGQLEASGDVTFAGPIDWTGALRSVGIVRLTSGGNYIAHVYAPYGSLKLQDDLHTGSHEWKSGLNTNGHALTVDGLAYPLEESYSYYEDSDVAVGEWVDYPFELFDDRWTEQYSDDAAFTTTRPHSTFAGAGWEYGSIVWADSESVASLNSYGAGSLTVDAPLVTMESGSTITTGALSFGPGAHTLRSSGSATIVCGCKAPPGVTLEGVEVE